MPQPHNQSDDASYVDEKGRTRWRRNDEIAEKLKELGDFLIIGGYDESHAARYAKLAYTVSRYPESVTQLHQEGRLHELPGIGRIIAEIIGEFLTTGTSAKMTEASDENGYTPPPDSIRELIRIPRLGAKTIRTLYQEYGINSLYSLSAALDAGETLGLGAKMRDNLREHIRKEVRHGA